MRTCFCDLSFASLIIVSFLNRYWATMPSNFDVLSMIRLRLRLRLHSVIVLHVVVIFCVIDFGILRMDGRLLE